MASSFAHIPRGSIPYTQHWSCNGGSGFGVIDTNICGNNSLNSTQASLLNTMKNLYQAGFGIRIDRTGPFPIISWDQSSSGPIGDCSTNLEIRGDVITYKGGEHLFTTCPGPLVANNVHALNATNIANITDQTFINVGPAMPYTNLVANQEQYGIPMVFSSGSQVPSGTANDMTFVLAPYQKDNTTKGLAISTVDALGVLTARMIVTA